MKALLRWSLSLGVFLFSQAAVSRAGGPDAENAAPNVENTASKVESAAPKAEDEAPKPAEKPCPATVAVEPAKKPTRLPVYVADWGRLAALTESDPVVFAKADSWASRERHVRWGLVPIGLLIGGGLAVAGTVARLKNDHWTDATKWAAFSGVSVAAVTLLVSWALSPERDDLLTVINHWNLRHPDRPLAP